MLQLFYLKMKAIMLTASSFLLTTAVIANAYYQKKQFYPSVVYLTKSNPSMAVLYVQAFVFVILFGKLVRKVFFGQLRAAEMEHLIERSWYAVTETCLAFTVFRDDFSPRFVGLFTLLLFLKCFHWLAEDRVDFMERSPLISWLFHFRAIALLAALGIVDAYFVSHAYHSTLTKGASVQLVFGFEYAILFTAVLTVSMKYVLHTIDLQSENPWENKTVFLLYTDLLLGCIKVVLYVLFLAIMIRVHTFPLFAIRPMYLTMRAFKKALQDVIMSRRAIRNMNTLYPSATAEELASGDNVCIICREEMTDGTNCKKLPCSHIFHTSCLRSWFQRQQTCPTCRMDVLRNPLGVTQPPAANAAAQQPQPQQPPAQPPHAPNVPFMPGFAAGAMQMPWQQPPQPAAPGVSSETTAATTTMPAASASVPTAQPGMPAGVPPFMNPFMPMMPMPFMMPMPQPPANLSGLSDAELRAMEGQERQNVEARVTCLRDIQTLLDAAMVQIQQYTTIVNNLGTSPSQNPWLQTPWASSGGNTTTVTATDTVMSTSTADEQSSTSRPAAPVSTVTTSVTSIDSTQTTTPTASGDNLEQLNLSDLEGAVGYTPPKEEIIPEWADPREEEPENEELNELRRRRLERFSSQTKDLSDSSSPPREAKDNLELD